MQKLIDAQQKKACARQRTMPRGGAWYHDLFNWFTDDPEARRQAEANKRYGESLKDPNWLHKQLVKQKSAYDKQKGGRRKKKKKAAVHIGPKGGRHVLSK